VPDLPPACGTCDSVGNQIAEWALNVVRKGVPSKMSRILVVEDETHLAMELAWLLQEAGYAVVGPERSVEEARKALTGVAVDLALLDVDLGGEEVFAISKMLEGMGIPFVFMTSRAGLLPTEYRTRPLVTKPCKPTALLALIPQVLADRPTAPT
jgi:DNA-binding response OmpR family regulator